MKLVFIACERCGKTFYCETLLTDNRLPLHCPGCDTYIDHADYVRQVGPSVSSALTRIRKPLNEATIPEILYMPEKKG
ncbi:MAG: hypothetical protein A4E60_03458 [Syntrophorhabdus sp. PtaB.Bin047]|jgi:uncharacterized C2H2 Zn-finger protein|nr:MAG: hypothetical protein A4E60_03458 [Syntrophorhabdus sp. PtaB.Bin047]